MDKEERQVLCKVTMGEVEWEAAVSTLEAEGFLVEGATDEEALAAFLEFGCPWESEKRTLAVERITK